MRRKLAGGLRPAGRGSGRGLRRVWGGVEGPWLDWAGGLEWVWGPRGGAWGLGVCRGRAWKLGVIGTGPGEGIGSLEIGGL